MKKVILLALWGVLVAAVLVFLPAPAQAGGTVGSGSGTCTQAALDARLAGGGLITFNCGPAPVTIVVTGFKTITLPTTIDGGGLVTLSGGNTNPIFDVEASSLTLRNLTLRDGFSKGGGAIYNGSQLNLSNTNFISNSAFAIGGAIYAFGPMTITGGLFLSNTTVSGSGGAIFNDGPGTISGTTFLANMSGFGGGAIYNDTPGSLVIQASTLQSNTVSGTVGGAILNEGQLTITRTTFDGNSSNFSSAASLGGGLALGSSGVAQVADSTFAGNSALVGGGLVTSGTLTLINTTLSGNAALGAGGALVQSGTMTLLNTTFQDNTSLLFGTAALAAEGSAHVTLVNTLISGDPSHNCSGSLISLGHNLDDGHTCGLTVVSDLTDTNPLLAPLGRYGGPTQTAALLPGSPAIDHGDDVACPTDDQRGFLRVGHCDIGAFEFYAHQLLLPLLRR